MKALFNAPGDGGRNQKLPPRTAVTTGRARQSSKRAGNSLNLHAATSQGSQKRFKETNNQNQNILLGRIEKNKYVTERDTVMEAQKLDEGKRRQRLEKVNYQLFSEELLNAEGNESALVHIDRDYV